MEYLGVISPARLAKERFVDAALDAPVDLPVAAAASA